MTKELAIQILRGEVLGTNEQTHEAVFMAIKALKNEQKHGKWLDFGWPHCSECGYEQRRRTNYCPNCGAEMKGSDNGQT